MPRSPVPAYTWRHQPNNAVSEVDDDTMRAELLLQMKTAMLGGGTWTDRVGTAVAGPAFWTIDSSCDGAVAGTAADAVDRWIDNGDLVWETSGTAHSWVVFVHPNFFGSSQPLYMLWDCSEAGATTANGTLGIFLAEAAFTGGTTTARPTSTDEAEVLPEDGTGTGNSSGWQGDDSATPTAKSAHITMSDDGTKFRAHITDNGFCQARWDLFLVNDAPVGWSRPVLMSVMSDDNGAAESNTWGNAWNSSLQGGRYHGFDSVLGEFICNAGMPGYGGSETAHTTFPGNSFDAAIMPAPIPLVGDGSPVSGHVAVVPDCWWIADANGTGDHAEDDTGNLRQFAQFGEMLVENNRSTIVAS